VCNRILNLEPSDGLAFHCKMVAMIQTGKFDEALKQMEAAKFDLDLSFEQAYCYYRLNSLERSLAVLESVKNPQVTASLLSGPILSVIYF
jgi:signal recognition particle subunit SRP72